MSARRPMVRGLLPTFSVPTTPVRPTPRVTVMPATCICRATLSAVRVSWKPSSGWAWMSCRQAVMSACSGARVSRVVAEAVIGISHGKGVGGW